MLAATYTYTILAIALLHQLYIMVVMHMHTSESFADTDGCCLRLPPLLLPVCACIMMLSLNLYQNLVAYNYKFISIRYCVTFILEI